MALVQRQKAEVEVAFVYAVLTCAAGGIFCSRRRCTASAYVYPTTGHVMTRYVLVSDNTLLYDFLNFPLLDFLPAAPVKSLPEVIYKFFRGHIAPPTERGELRYAPYALRKLEAGLLKAGVRSEDIAVAHPFFLNKHITDNTEIIAVSTMDPFGLGPTTMSYSAIMHANFLDSYVRKEWEALIAEINRLRTGKKAKLVIGGPGVWEYTILRDEVDKQQVDYLFSGEADDIIAHLFQQVHDGSFDHNMFIDSYVTYDEAFHRVMRKDERFLSRGPSISSHPALESIPDIVRPSIKGMTEVMRGCGIGCDFCEVTLRPLRYYPVDKIIREISVNRRLGGFNHAWIHSDEIFAYKHLKNYVPDHEALIDLFTKIMAVEGIEHANPTHGRISIPAAYPELIEKLSSIMKAGRGNWIGIQVGVETGSESLALKHMPAKTLPLKIGVDDGWQEIVWKGVYNFTKYYWRPAFTLQVNQSGETDDDNWDTVALINRLSNSFVDGRPFEFSITPLYNMPLGRIKSKEVDEKMTLTPSMLAVYYASHRHLAKMAKRDAWSEAKGNPLSRAVQWAAMPLGADALVRVIGSMAKKSGVDIEKAKNYGMGSQRRIETYSALKAMV